MTSPGTPPGAPLRDPAQHQEHTTEEATPSVSKSPLPGNPRPALPSEAARERHA